MQTRDNRNDSKDEITPGGVEDEVVVVVKRRVMRGKHELFDKIAFNVLSYLETFDEVGDIEFSAPDGSATVCKLWETKNAPYVLPFDVKGFSDLFNGVSLKWAVEVGTASVAVGNISINKVDAMVKVDLTGQFLKHSEGRDALFYPPDPSTAAGFEIANAADGIVVMLFRTKPSNGVGNSCEIWFKDTLTLTWHFVCHTFTQYLRLCILHLGVFGWHKIFTPAGITMTTRQWMGMFCRERLCVYQHYHSLHHNGSGRTNAKTLSSTVS